MNRFKIGLIECDQTFADEMVKWINKYGFELTSVASSYEKALKIIEEEMPHLVLINFNLNGEKDGIELAQYIKKHYSFPFIFIADHLDLESIERSKELIPSAILEKPFTNIELFANIELALINHEAKLEYIMVKDGYSLIRVCLNHILYVDSERNYLNLYLLTGRKVVIRSTMSDLMAKLNEKYFHRINRGYIININYITKIETDKVYINECQFSISKQQRSELVSLLEKSMQRSIP